MIQFGTAKLLEITLAQIELGTFDPNAGRVDVEYPLVLKRSGDVVISTEVRFSQVKLSFRHDRCTREIADDALEVLYRLGATASL